MSLTLTTSMNATFKVPARGVGVLSPLRLSYSVIRLGAAVPGEVLSSSVFLANTSSEPGVCDQAGEGWVAAGWMGKESEC
jgi:hypothetical protein